MLSRMQRGGQEPFTWHVVRTEGDRNFVDVTNHGRVILSLEVDALPNACPKCGPPRCPILGRRRLAAPLAGVRRPCGALDRFAALPAREALCRATPRSRRA
jgi:hypothetical protein